MTEKELVEAIDDLGDFLAYCQEMTNSIYEDIKKKMEDQPMHRTYIYQLKSTINQAAYYYTMFHTNFFGSLLRK